MRYKLQRNANGMITQCENADGGNIYAQREELNKKALENLQRPTPGKLGNLSNLQVFNFRISDFDTGSDSVSFKEFNTTSTFPANATQTIMFGVDGLNNKALYYNVLDIKATVNDGGSANFQLQNESYIEFYTLQNNVNSTSSLGTKIPQPAPLSGNGGGAVTFTTDGNEFGVQSVQINIGDDAVNVPSNLKGIRCSGLALKTILLMFNASENKADFKIDVAVYVDVSSVSTSF